jgi:hypothetical protein
MLANEIIRNKIRDEVYSLTGKKVRNILYVTSGTDGRSVYAVVGNNNKIFGVVMVDVALGVEVMI